MPEMGGLLVGRSVGGSRAGLAVGLCGYPQTFRLTIRR